MKAQCSQDKKRLICLLGGDMVWYSLKNLACQTRRIRQESPSGGWRLNPHSPNQDNTFVSIRFYAAVQYSSNCYCQKFCTMTWPSFSVSLGIHVWFYFSIPTWRPLVYHRNSSLKAERNLVVESVLGLWVQRSLRNDSFTAYGECNLREERSKDTCQGKGRWQIKRDKGRGKKSRCT